MKGSVLAVKGSVRSNYTDRTPNRVTNIVDAAGTTLYGYAAGGQLWTEDLPSLPATTRQAAVEQ